MKNFFKKLKLVFSYGSEIEDILRDAHNVKAEKMRKQKANYLHLCFSHQQEENHSHYSEHNCDYCKLLKRNEKLDAEIIKSGYS